MDFMYLPDTISYYPTFRNSWNITPYEPDVPLWIKAGQPLPKQQQQQQTAVQNQEKRGSHGGSCPLCKERQRRRLASYIRSKSRQDSECTIEEEEEEVADEGQGTQEQKSPSVLNQNSH